MDINWKIFAFEENGVQKCACQYCGDLGVVSEMTDSGDWLVHPKCFDRKINHEYGNYNKRMAEAIDAGKVVEATVIEDRDLQFIYLFKTPNAYVATYNQANRLCWKFSLKELQDLIASKWGDDEGEILAETGLYCCYPTALELVTTMDTDWQDIGFTIVGE